MYRVSGASFKISSERQFESQLDEEVRAYVDTVADERIAAGMSVAEARRSALAEFGGIEQVKQAVRELRIGTGVELLWQDARYGVRQLRRNRGFTVAAVITLGLGIGATTAIFSAVYSLLLRPLPYRDSNQLMYVSSAWPKTHVQGATLPSPEFVAARSETKSFEQFAGYIFGDDNLTGAGDPVRVTRAGVTANFFNTLGVAPQLGRNFLHDEDRSGGPLVILLSNRLWRDQFNADPEIVGKAVTLNGTQHVVVGVLPQHFSFPDLQVEPDYYVPVALERDTTLSVTKAVWGMHVIARLNPGVSMEQAQAEMQAFFEARAQSYPAAFAGWTAGRQMIVEPLQRHLTGDDRKPLYILLVCVAAVLLIACANVANLQLARAVSRRHETALRGALGASRVRLIRQFLIESLILSSLAAALGLTIAAVVTSLIRHAQMTEGTHAFLTSHAAQLLRLPFGKLSASIAIDGWVLAFTVGLALLTTLVFGLAPAIGGTRMDLRNTLQTAAMGLTPGREQRLLRHSLLVIEVGLAVVLLASAGLLARSFVSVMHYESGFDSSNTLTGVTLLSRERYPSSGERIRNFVDQLLLRLKALPGVEVAAVTTALPLESYIPNGAILYEGVPIPPIGKWPTAAFTKVTPEYFRAVGTPIFRGRTFTLADNETSIHVAIVNRTFARQFFAGDALGKRFKTNTWGQNQFTAVTIVGIADDVRHSGLEHEVQPEIFLPMAQLPEGRINIALRISGDPGLLANAMREAVTAVDPEQPLFDIQTMEERVSSAVAQRRLIMSLIACFAMLAVVLSAVGVYGVFAYSVSQRAHEMGIRLALGASRRGSLRLVVMQAARLIVLGGALGLAVAFALSRFLASLLVGITPHDAVSFSLAWLLMTVVALLASTIPATDAARTDIVSVLHSE